MSWVMTAVTAVRAQVSSSVLFEELVPGLLLSIQLIHVAQEAVSVAVVAHAAAAVLLSTRIS